LLTKEPIGGAPAVVRLPFFSRGAPAPEPPAGSKRWIVDPAALPWFEQPDALARVGEIARRWSGSDALAGGQAGQLEGWLEAWVRDGYFVVEKFVPPALVDGIGTALDEVWRATAPVPGLTLYDVTLDGEKVIHCPHARLVAEPHEFRPEIERQSFWRIPELHAHDERVRRLYEFDAMRTIASAIFDRPAVPQFSLTFGKGSRQPMHQDTYVFHVWPMQFICGVWIACEDIRPDSGPLGYYPGSHREPLYPGFDNYPQTQCRTASDAEIAGYGRYLEEAMARHPYREFLARKGDALFWHGMLIHGGAPVRDERLSRRSFVVHLLPPGASRGHEVEGPFNW
jgi:hypothetical protein